MVQPVEPLDDPPPEEPPVVPAPASPEPVSSTVPVLLVVSSAPPPELSDGVSVVVDTGSTQRPERQSRPGSQPPPSVQVHASVPGEQPSSTQRSEAHCRPGSQEPSGVQAQVSVPTGQVSATQMLRLSLQENGALHMPPEVHAQPSLPISQPPVPCVPSKESPSVERKHAEEPITNGATKANKNVRAELRMVISRLEVTRGLHKPRVTVSEGANECRTMV